MPQYAAIDIGSRTIKGIVVGGSLKKPRVLRFAAVVAAEVPAGGVLPGEDLAAALESLSAKLKLPRDRVVVSIPAERCIIREALLPFTDDEQIKKTITFAAEDHISCSAEEVVLDYHKLGEVGGKSKVLVVAIRREYLRALSDVLKKCRIEPLAFDVDLVGVLNVILTQTSPVEGAQVILDVGATSTKIVVVENGNISLMRAARVAAIAAGVSPASEETVEAVPVTEPAAADREEIPPEAVERFVGRLERELRRSLAPIQAQSQISSVVVTGGLSDLPGVSEMLIDVLGVAPTHLKLTECVSVKLDDDAQRTFDMLGAGVLGLALKTLGELPISLNFRQDEFRPVGLFQRFKAPMAACMTLVLAGLIMVAVGQQKKLELKQVDKRNLEKQMKNVWEGAFGNRASTPRNDFVNKLGKKLKDKKEGRSKGAPPKWVSVLDVLIEINNYIPEQHMFEARSLSIKQEKDGPGGSIRATTEKAETVEKIEEALNKSPIIKASSSNIKLEKSGIRYSFDMNFVVVDRK